MAQIIKHRRGSLESLSSVTGSLQKGEIVIASGSSNLTTTNGSSLVFAVPENGQVQATNRFLIGDAAPNTFAGSTYNGMVKGVPYYASGSSTLYLLGTDGNEAINLVGNIQPFSASVASSINALSSSIGSGTIGNSVSLLNSYTASNDTTNDAQDARLSSLEAFSGSQLGKDATLATYTASVDAHISAINTFSASQISKDATLATYTASIDAHVSAVNAFSASQLGKDSTLATYTASVDAHIAAINTFSASQEGKDSALATYTGSVNSKFSTLGSYTASVDADLTELYATASNHEGRIDTLETFQSDIETAITVSGSNVTVNGNFTVSGTQTIVDSTTIQIGDNIIELNGSGAANGGLWVKDATNPNTETGSIVWDSTNDYWKAGVKGSESKVLLAGGDNVVSGSSQITISDTTGYGDFSGSVSASIAAVVANVGSGVGVSIENLNSFTASAITRLDNLEATGSDHESRIGVNEGDISTINGTLGDIDTAQGVQDGRLTSLESFSGSVKTQLTQIGVVSGSLIASASAAKSTNDSQGLRLDSIEAFSGSANSKFTEIGVVSGSLIVSASAAKSANDSQDVSITNLNSFSSSVLTQLTEIGVVSGSLISSASAAKSTNDTQDGRLDNLQSKSASVDIAIAALNSYTSSNTSTTALNAFTASAASKFTEIGVVSGSLIASASNADSRLTTLEGTGTIQGVGQSDDVVFATVTTTGDVVIGGDLVVQGNTVTLNTATLVVEDKLITLASGSTSNATADGAGFEVAGTSASFKYDGIANQFSSSVDIVANTTGSVNLGSAAGNSKRIAFRNTNGNLDLVPTASVAGDLLQWDGTDFVMSNTIDGGSF